MTGLTYLRKPTCASGSCIKAKARLSELIRLAEREGPQEITVRGVPTAVVVSKAAFERLSGSKPSLVEFLQHSPLAGLDLKVDRDESPPRDVTV